MAIRRSYCTLISQYIFQKWHWQPAGKVPRSYLLLFIQPNIVLFVTQINNDRSFSSAFRQHCATRPLFTTKTVAKSFIYHFQASCNWTLLFLSRRLLGHFDKFFSHVPYNMYCNLPLFIDQYTTSLESSKFRELSFNRFWVPVGVMIIRFSDFSSPGNHFSDSE